MTAFKRKELSCFPVFCCLLFFLTTTVSCKSKDEYAELQPPETPLFSRDVISYGVVNLSFVNLLENPAQSSAVRTLVRKGEIVRVLERRALSSTADSASREIWVYAATGAGNNGEEEAKSFLESVSGWLREQSIDSYENLEQARNAAQRMTR